MDQGNLMEREWSINQENLVSHLTWLVLTATFLKTSKFDRMVDRSGKPDERNSSNAQIRTLLEEHRQTIIAEYREKVSQTRTPCSSRRRRAPTPTRTIMAADIGISWSSSTKSYRNRRITEVPDFYLRYDRETKTHRWSEHYFGIIRQSTGTAKGSKSYERF